MAGGQLVPHQLPDGRTVMVPDYLLPPQAPQLALPSVPAPNLGPDRRLALGPGGGPQDLGDAPPDLSVFAAEDQAARAADFRAKLAGPPPSTNEHAPPPDRVAELSRLGNKPAPGAGKVDPSTLATGRPQAQPQADQNGGMDPLVRRVFNEGPRGGGGGPGGLTVGSIKEEREPGRQLLPEQLWQLGVEQRPDFGEEVDPEAHPYRNRQTLELEPTKMRKVLTPIERGAEQEGTTARQQFELQERDRQAMGIAQRQALAEQSNAIDSQLAGIADRRKRIADLHEIADRRMQEAESQEPRTRGEIWESKGNLARGTAILAAVLSGAAAGLQGRGGSPAWNDIERAIDDDVKDEQYKAERRMKLGLEAKNDLERAQALYGDLDIALLETKQRKSANVLAAMQQMLSDRSLDESAKMRGAQVYEAGKAAYLARQQQLMDMLTGHAIKQEVTYKPAATGGGGLDTLARLERAARAKKAEDVITGAADKPKPNPTEQAALNEAEADLVPLKGLLSRYRNADQIPGIAGRNIVSRAARSVADVVAGEGAGTRALDTDEERANRIIVNRARLAYRHQVTGAGGSDAEAARIDEAFAGARTKHDLQIAANLAEQVIAERRRLAAGGSSTAAQAPQRAASEEPGN